MARSPYDLSIRTASVELQADVVDFTPLISAEAAQPTYRLIQLAADLDPDNNLGGPCEVELQWSAGGGALAPAYLHLARGTWVCVFASSIILNARSFKAHTTLRVAIADGQMPTLNRHMVIRKATSPGDHTNLISPWAQSVRVSLNDPTLLSTTTLKLCHGQSYSTSQVKADAQPAAGLPVGGATFLKLNVPSACEYRLEFELPF